MLEPQAVRQQPQAVRQQPQAVRQQPPVSRQRAVRQQQAPAELVKRLLTAVSVSSPMQVMWVVRQQLAAQRHVRAQVRQLGQADRQRVVARLLRLRQADRHQWIVWQRFRIGQWVRYLRHSYKQ